MKCIGRPPHSTYTHRERGVQRRMYLYVQGGGVPVNMYVRSTTATKCLTTPKIPLHFLHAVFNLQQADNMSASEFEIWNRFLLECIHSD